MRKSRAFNSLVRALSGLVAHRGDATVSGVASDSRLVEPGEVFIAYRGFEADGHDFIEPALANGAAAVVFDDPRHEKTVEGVPWARVENARRACAELAAEYYGHPSAELLLAGVTGTNGKTTTTFLIDSILRAAGMRSGVIGTLGYGPVDDLAEAPRTTPDAVELQTWLRRMADEGLQAAVMEVSSHSLVLSRPWRCHFDVGVFTNLSQDHLDFHEDIERYLDAKLLLFTEYAEASDTPMIGAVNLDDEFGPRIAQRASCPVLGYGLSEGCDVRAEDVRPTDGGSTFELWLPSGRATVNVPLPGLFNVYNALAAATAAEALEVETDAIVKGLSDVTSVPGRFERVDAGQPFGIIVDYAHTPQAVENVLGVARQLQPRRIICVIGCGGDRDPDKRPRMGRAATELADFTIITSDNPRSEDPLAIIEAITAGVVGDAWTVEPDRREAIRKALEMAGEGDMIMILGKGHETYQVLADRTIDFDDRAVARQIAAELYG
ncbi:MAG: UDP-N-acetylmuramoyl-L-alanyl-D-glutamate--2,6-diaminopimelate ligase [Armatimonadota bacterium]